MGVTIDGFSRQETMQLTGCTSSRLAYLEKVDLIVPTRMGNPKRPIVLFSWEQLLEIKAIANLREQDVSLQTVRKIIGFLDKHGYDDTLRDKHLVAAVDEVFWVKQDWSDLGDQMRNALRVAGKNGKGVGQYVLTIVPPLNDIVNEIWKNAESSGIISIDDFKERAKGRLSQVAS